MVEQIVVELIYPAFGYCAKWTGDLLNSVGGKGVVLGVFMIVLAIGLLLIPMRGNAVTNIKMYGENAIHSKQKSSKKSTKAN